MTKKSKYLLICLLGIVNAVRAQEFRIHSALNTVHATGFYKIAIDPQLGSYAKTDLSDIRIAAESGSYVPYIIRGKQPQLRDTPENRELQILNNETDKHNTTIVLASGSAAWTTAIVLIMNNTSVERYAQVSGSDDNERWYIIDDHILLQRAASNNNGTYSQRIDFPKNRYQYFKLKINNAHTDPLNIVAARGTYNKITIGERPDMLVNPAPEITQKDSSNHISYVAIRNAESYLVDEVSLIISGPNFYERSITIYAMSTDQDSVALNYPVASFTLSSIKPAVFALPKVKAHTILIEVENKDSPPLKILQATTRQEQQYLISWLEKDKHYTLLAANDNALTPQYDLTEFTDSIPSLLPSLSYGVFTAVPHTAVNISKPATPNYLLWIVIVGSVAVLSMLTYRLMKDMSNRERKG